MIRLKCSRTQPCDSCLRTGDSDDCLYASRSSHQNNDISLDQNTRQILAARISKLENLLLSVTSAGKSPKSSSAGNEHFGADMSHVPKSSPDGETCDHKRTAQGDQDMDGMSEAFGLMKVDHVGDQPVYFGGAHWISIMSEVCSEIGNLGILC